MPKTGLAPVPAARHLLRKELADARYFDSIGVDDMAAAAGRTSVAGTPATTRSPTRTTVSTCAAPDDRPERVD